MNTLKKWKILVKEVVCQIYFVDNALFDTNKYFTPKFMHHVMNDLECQKRRLEYYASH